MVPFENNNKLKYLRAHTHRETERRAILSHKINGSHNKQIAKTENTSIMFVRSFVRLYQKESILDLNWRDQTHKNNKPVCVCVCVCLCVFV